MIKRGEEEVRVERGRREGREGTERKRRERVEGGTRGRE